MSDGIRLNKYISDAGVCSRREADRLIEAGSVRVEDRVADLGTKVLPGQKVYVNEKLIKKVNNTVIYVYNKPVGQVCTSAGADKESIFNYISFPEKVNYVGRLDKDSQGLLLLTNDGELANEIQKSKNNHEKEYFVRVNKDITEDFIKNMGKNVPILDTVTKRCRVTKTGTRTFRIVLTQGLNRQIRRMCEYFGYRVMHLKRVRVMNINLGDLKLGEYRQITAEEEKKLRELVRKDVD